MEELKEIVKGITQSQIDDDIEVQIISGFGGMVCGKCKVSEVMDLVGEEERAVNRDYFIVIPE